MQIPTINVVSDSPETGGYIVINADDFDAAIHVEYVEPSDVDAKKSAKKTEA